MNSKLKTRTSSTALVAILLLSIAVMFPIFKANAVTTYLEMTNTETGDNIFNYTTVSAPPTGPGYPLGYLLANVTVKDVSRMAGWQLNVTWDTTLMRMEGGIGSCVIKPADHVFHDLGPLFFDSAIVIDNVIGTMAYGAAATAGTFNGTGTCIQLKFNITRVPAKDETLSGVLHFVLEGEDPVFTYLGYPGDEGIIPCTMIDGEYTYMYETAPLPKPYLEVVPKVSKLGEPMGPSIIGTSKAIFTIDIVINNLVNESGMIGYQLIFKYPLDYMVIIPDSGTGENATEGPFMGNPAWNHSGTWLKTIYGGIDEDNNEWFSVIGFLWPNPDTGEWDWGVFPSTEGLSQSQRVLCSMTFEATVQEEYPWEKYIVGAFDIEPVEGNYFVNYALEQIPHQAEIDGDYYIKGWILGLMLDVYTQHPSPFGGQGLNMTSDMFYPQSTVHLFAKLTYNANPVQNKPVAFQVFNEQGFVNFTKVAITNSQGVAEIYFGIEWPCNGSEALIFGKWTVVATSSVREKVAWDWTWFKVNYLVMNMKATVDPINVHISESAHVIVTFDSFRQQPVNVLIHVVILDDLLVPIGKQSKWILVGTPELEFCTNHTYRLEFDIPIPKWAFVGVGHVEVSALSNWPTLMGYPFCPEATTEFNILV